MLTNRVHGLPVWLAGSLSFGAWLAACGDSAGNGPDGSGAASGWTFVPPGSGATTSTGGTSGTAGSPQAGQVGNAGSSAGSGGAPPKPVTFACGHLVPSQPIITSFDGYQADRWKSPGNLDGGGYAYPDSLALSTGDFLGTEGQIGDYSGIGAWFSGCVDASKFKGVRFNVSGSVGGTSSVQFYLITNRTKEVNEADGVGECVPVDPNDAWSSCRPPSVTVAVSSAPTTHSIPWSAFEGGRPEDTTNGSDIIALQWSFVWDESNAYPAKLTIDDLAFYTDDAPDPGGGGGAGGAPNSEGGAPPTPAGGAADD